VQSKRCVRCTGLHHCGRNSVPVCSGAVPDSATVALVFLLVLNNNLERVEERIEFGGMKTDR